MKTIGFAMCGSFCTFEKAVGQMEALSHSYAILPLMSQNAYTTDTRFGKAQDWVRRVEGIAGRPVLHTIVQAEPIGPKGLVDLLAVAPCTGNTLSKIAAGITDTPVTMAVKSALRIGIPVVLCCATNDAMAASGPNLLRLLNTKNVYLVPLRQDDPVKKPVSLVADFTLLPQAIALALEKEGYRVLRAYDGMEALDHALDPELRLILMDVMMPRLDGLSAVLRIRERRNLPIIVLSAKSEESDKVLGLSMGADDYVTKPFSTQELVARVRSQLRRYTQLGDVNAQGQGGEIVNGRLCYKPEERVLLVDGEPVKLTATELKIVDLLMRNLGRIFPAEEIYRRVWNEEAYATENTVMVHIRRIREKIELNPKEPEYLKVVWGIGYKIEKH